MDGPKESGPERRQRNRAQSGTFNSNSEQEITEPNRSTQHWFRDGGAEVAPRYTRFRRPPARPSRTALRDAAAFFAPDRMKQEPRSDYREVGNTLVPVDDVFDEEGGAK